MKKGEAAKSNRMMLRCKYQIAASMIERTFFIGVQKCGRWELSTALLIRSNTTNNYRRLNH